MSHTLQSSWSLHKHLCAFMRHCGLFCKAFPGSVCVCVYEPTLGRARVFLEKNFGEVGVLDPENLL